MTATQEVYIDGTEFNAELLTFTFPNPSVAPVFVTFRYPKVTITSLTPLQTLTIVSATLIIGIVNILGSK